MYGNAGYFWVMTWTLPLRVLAFSIEILGLCLQQRPAVLPAVFSLMPCHCMDVTCLLVARAKLVALFFCLRCSARDGTAAKLLHRAQALQA